MPVFNTARFLQLALDSIKGQTFADFEIVAIDDGSSDGSTQILERFAAAEPRMKLVVRENRGLIATRNELLSAARGELVAWMDSDDVSLPGRLAAQIAVFSADPALACLGTAAQCIDPEGNDLNVERYPAGHQEILVDQQQKFGAMRFPTTMMRRAVALEAGGFREPFRIGEDFDFLLRLSEIGKMANLPDILYLYRSHISSVCATLGPRWAVHRDQILQLARERRTNGKDRLQSGGSITIPESEIIDKKSQESLVYNHWARAALMNENFPLAWKYARAAVAKRPGSLTGWKTFVRVLLDRYRKRN
jgi:glycosyltransferase involved in cell wall biosynthesis